jgi:hypothetical protein
MAKTKGMSIEEKEKLKKVLSVDIRGQVGVKRTSSKIKLKSKK